MYELYSGQLLSTVSVSQMNWCKISKRLIYCLKFHAILSLSSLFWLFVELIFITPTPYQMAWLEEKPKDRGKPNKKEETKNH